MIDRAAFAGIWRLYTARVSSREHDPEAFFFGCPEIDPKFGNQYFGSINK